MKTKIAIDWDTMLRTAWLSITPNSTVLSLVGGTWDMQYGSILVGVTWDMQYGSILEAINTDADPAILTDVNVALERMR